MIIDSYKAKSCSIPPVCQISIPAKYPAGVYGKQDEYPETVVAKARSKCLAARSPDYSDLIVINPGSRHLKIGRASDPLPKIVPHLIAHRKRDANKPPVTMRFAHDDDAFYSEVFGNLFNARLQTLKRKPMPSSPGQVHNFNSNVEPRAIPEHNDPYAIDWTVPHKDSTYFCGEEAKYLDNSHNAFVHRYPIRMGTFNNVDYESIHEVLLDLSRIWTMSLSKYFGIVGQQKLCELSCLLILPDNVQPEELKHWCTLALRLLPFRSVAFIQEAVASTFGSGAATGCVIDMGSQKTSLSCVEEGFLLPDSAVTLPYGGDSLTKLFLEFLSDAAFPYAEANLNDPADFDLISELKNNAITLLESDTYNISTFEFYVRKPGRPTMHYNVKMYEERIMTPLALFTPNSIPTFDLSDTMISNDDADMAEKKDQAEENQKDAVENQSDAVGNQNNVSLQSKHLPTLDEALLKCMSGNAEGTDRIERIKKFKNAIILVGGECAIPNFCAFLQQKISSLLEPIEGLDDMNIHFYKGPSKDLDLKMITWKGGCVFCKIDSSNDYWICQEEFEARGLKAISQRVNFSVKLE